MALFDMFRSFAFFKGRATEGLQEDDLNFQKWIEAHRQWRQRLQAYLEGRSQEQLDETAICQDNRCELGQWIHSNGQKYYGDQATFQRLTCDHAAFHRSAGDVVSTFKNKGDRDARRVLNGEFDLCSMRVIDDLEQLERRVKQ